MIELKEVVEEVIKEILKEEIIKLPTKNIETVMGTRFLLDLGKILPHEHPAFDINPKMPYLEDIHPYINLHNYEIYKQKPTIYANTCLCDQYGERSFFYDINNFKKCGGLTIVDNSSYGMRRNFNFLYRICRITKINVLLGTGFSEPAVLTKLQNTTEKLYDIMRNDLEEGFNWNMIPVELRPLNYLNVRPKAAFIGEVGNDWPISDYVRRSIAATGQVQENLGCPVNFAPSFHPDAPAEILRIYQEAGGDARKAVMSHVDCALSDRANFLEFLDNTNCYVQFSSFGFNTSILPDSDCTVLTDVQRVKRIAIMKEENSLHRVLISHNIRTKDRLISYGGHGYSFIMKDISQYMQDVKNFTFKEMLELTFLNPAIWLARST